MDEQVQALLAHGEEHGCLEFSEVDEVAQTLDLEDEDVQAIYEEIERRGIDLKDDCARESAAQPTYVNGDLAHATTDALQRKWNPAALRARAAEFSYEAFRARLAALWQTAP